MGFMAKVIERRKAINLRKKGKSIKTIAKVLNISKSTISIWCRDIKLTKKQIERLHESMVRGSYSGRIKGAKLQHEKRIKREKEAKILGIKEIGKLSERDLLMVLVALYWGEGAKKKREFFIVNSDPDMIKFMLNALRKIFTIKNDRFILGVAINTIHKGRDEEIKDYWSKITKIPKSRFRKTIFIKSKNKKIYDNFQNYHGMLRINISKSIDIYNRMIGLIRGLNVGI